MHGPEYSTGGVVGVGRIRRLPSVLTLSNRPETLVTPRIWSEKHGAVSPVFGVCRKWGHSEAVVVSTGRIAQCSRLEYETAKWADCPPITGTVISMWPDQNHC